MNQPHEAVQRMRLTYSVEGALIYVAVLDLGRMWERLLRRAGVPLAYSQGFNPHTRLQFAAPLPVGYSSECELLDVWLRRSVHPGDIVAPIRAQSPRGLTLHGVVEVPLRAPAPQSSVRLATYRVRLHMRAGCASISESLARFLAQESAVRTRNRKGRQQDYDLRQLVQHVTHVGEVGGEHELSMILACGPGGSGRAEEVLAALDLPVESYSVHRTHLVWGDAEG